MKRALTEKQEATLRRNWLRYNRYHREINGDSDRPITFEEYVDLTFKTSVSYESRRHKIKMNGLTKDERIRKRGAIKKKKRVEISDFANIQLTEEDLCNGP